MDAVLHCRETQVSRRAATGTRSSLEIHVGLVSLVRPGSRDIKFRTIPFEGQHPLFESEADFRWRLVVSLKEWQPASPLRGVATATGRLTHRPDPPAARTRLQAPPKAALRARVADAIERREPLV
jgi:hypothetical protein